MVRWKWDGYVCVEAGDQCELLLVRNVVALQGKISVSGVMSLWVATEERDPV